MNTTYRQQIKAVQKARTLCSEAGYDALNDAGSTIAGWAFMEASIKARIKLLKKDKRLHKGKYPADLTDAPSLAMFQYALGVQLNTLEEFVGLPKTKLPI